MVDKILNVAEECLQLRNYNGIMICLSALQQAPIYRLKDTWEQLSAKTWQVRDLLWLWLWLCLCLCLWVWFFGVHARW